MAAFTGTGHSLHLAGVSELRDKAGVSLRPINDRSPSYLASRLRNVLWNFSVLEQAPTNAGKPVSQQILWGVHM